MDVYRSETGMEIFCPVQRTALSSLLSHIMGISIGTPTIMLMSMVPLMIIQSFSSMDLKLHSHGLYQALRSTALNVSGYSKDFCVMEPFGDDNASVKELKDYESRLMILIRRTFFDSMTFKDPDNRHVSVATSSWFPPKAAAFHPDSAHSHFSRSSREISQAESWESSVNLHMDI
ncbi:hypothetical protein SADUNF_Sadunf04G0121900 [Salix dunnii]|uniref:Uncharacterized protein n=1 Tax=Salix dunnii TaxID=1413687 RepID=A0A835K858_9ROSI|nr:hypothetical protein SADUNF_Sadunf04G0121900 [Salix dunnii]